MHGAAQDVVGEAQAGEYTFMHIRLVGQELEAELRADDGTALRIRPYKPAIKISGGDRVRLRRDGGLDMVSRGRDRRRGQGR